MERVHETEGRGDTKRRIARLVVMAGSACLIGWLLVSFDFGSRSVLFETIGVNRAEAAESSTGDLGKLRLLTRCVGFVRSNYVAPHRVKPLTMFINALKGAESVVADVMVTSDAEDPEQVTSVTVRVGDQQKTFDVGSVKDLYEMNWKLLDVFDFVSSYLSPDVKVEDVEYAAINGMLSTLDEHSIYLPPRAYKELKLDTQGHFGGLGIVITTRKGIVTVVSVLPETPASKAGLKSGDQLLEIGEESATNMNLSDAVTKLRGEPGTNINVLVQRKEWNDPRPFSLTRAEIRIQSVTSESLGDGIGYARLRHFQEDTTSELERQLTALKKRDSLRGLVLDLRQNPGGLLEQAVEVSDLFVRKGMLVVTEGEGRRMRQEYKASGDAAWADLPVVVLVDEGSASAAEIVAGALKGEDRAIVIGDTTFGKGTVQYMYEVGQGALKLTVAQYLTPGDISIQGVGISPDLQLAPVSVGGDRISLGFQERRERDPKRKLTPFGKVADDEPVARVPFLVDDKNERTGGEDEDEEPPLKDHEKFERDDPINLAATLLKSIQAPSRSRVLQDMMPVLESWKAIEDSKIIEAVRGRGVDWSAGPMRPGAAVRVSWSIDRSQPLLAGTKVKLRLSARNDGPDPVFRVHCRTESDNNAFDDREFVFGRIGPGETVVREQVVTVPKDTWDRLDQVAFHLFQGDTELGRPDPVIVAVKGLPRPRFAYSWQIQDAAGNADGQFNPGESARLFVDVRNLGEGPARKVLVTLRNRSGDGVYVRDGRVTLTNGIPSGGAAQARFGVELRRAIASGSITVEIGILDLEVREYMAEEITIPIVPASAERFDEASAAVRTRRAGVPLLGAAAAGAASLYELPESFVLRAAGRRGDFFKVDLDEGRFGFVRVGDVEVMGGVVRYSPLPETPEARAAEPELTVRMAGIDGSGPVGDTGHLEGLVRFPGHPGEARRKILVYRGNDKVFFWTRKGPTTELNVPIDSRLPLVEGRNDIAVYAIEGKDRSAVRRFTLYRSAAQVAESAATGTRAAVPATAGGAP